MKAIQVIFALVLALCCFNVGVFGNTHELGLTTTENECPDSCVNSNHDDRGRAVKCLCRSQATGVVDQCKATCIRKYSDQAFQKSYISKEGYCLCKKE